MSTSNITKVDGKEFALQGGNNLFSALSGRVTGLLIGQTSGLSGAMVKTQVEGQSSIGTRLGRLPGNDPLYVIDGVPFAPNNNSLQVLSSGSAYSPNGRSALISIDLGDIESVEVLKDADATAIYGARGSRGVVLITTKQGKVGKPAVNIDIANAISTVTRRVHMLDTRQFLQMRREALANDNGSPSATQDKDLLLYDTTGSIDVNRQLLSNLAAGSDAHFSVSAGSKSFQYYAGGGYHKESTVFPAALGDKRGGVQFRLSWRSSNAKLNVLFSANYANDVNQQIATDLTTALSLPPNSPALWDTSKRLNWGPPAFLYNNPVALLYQTYDAQMENVLSSILLTYHIMGDLYARATVGYNRVWSSEMSIIPLQSLNPYRTGDSGTAYWGQSAYSTVIAEPQLEYKHHFARGALTAMLGSSWQQITNNSNRYTAFGYLNDNNYFDTTAANHIQHDVPISNKYNYKGIFARVTYNWSDKYLINLTARNESSNRSGWAGRIGPFGAIGLGWIFTNESFLKDKNRVLSFGKLRASYGKTGNDPIGDYQYFDSPARNVSDMTGNAGAKLGWEITYKRNLGLELGFLSNRLYAIIDYFNNRSGNQLITAAPTAGSNSYTVINSPAIVQNAGFEIALKFNSAEHKDLSCSGEIVLTIPRNKLVSFPGLAASPYKLL